MDFSRQQEMLVKAFGGEGKAKIVLPRTIPIWQEIYCQKAENHNKVVKMLKGFEATGIPNAS